MADDDSVIIPGGDSGAELLAVLLFKVFLCRHQDIGGGVQLQEIRSEIPDDVIRHHEQGFVGQTKPLCLHCGGDHLVSLASPYYMAEQGVAAINCSGYCIALMRAQLLFGVHTGEYDMAPVIFAGPDGIKLFVVNPAQPIAAAWLRPNPLLKLLLNQVLFVLRDSGFLFIQDALLMTVRVLNGVENPHVPQIQGVLDNLIGVDPLCAIGVVGADIAAVNAFFRNIPFAGDLGITDVDAALAMPRRSQKLKGKIFNHIFGNPRRTQPHADFTSSQILGLYLFQRLYIDRIGGVALRRASGGFQLFPHPAGEVFVGGLPARKGVVAGFRIFENHPGKVALDLLNSVAPATHKACHKTQIHAGFFPDGNRKGFGGGVHPADCDIWLDGALAEHGGLAFQIPVFVQHFEGTQDRKAAVRGKGGGVGAAVQQPVFRGKAVVQAVQFPLLPFHNLVRRAFRLVFDQPPHTVADGDHTLYAALAGKGLLHREHPAVFPVIDRPVHQRKAEIADVRVGGDGFIFFLALQILDFVVGVFGMKILHSLRQQIRKAFVLKGLAGGFLGVAIHHVVKGHFAQHHLRVVDKILVDWHTVFRLPEMQPFQTGIRFRHTHVDQLFTLLQEDNVCRYLRTGVGVKGVVG